MATNHLSLLLLLSLFLTSTYVQPKPLPTSPYLSPSTVFFPDYQKMIDNFRIYMYTPPISFAFTTPSESLFYTHLLNISSNPFFTQNPNEANLFFIPFPPDLSPRKISRLVRDLRVNSPFWNRSLGADHFYLSRGGIGFASDRNILELKKNAVQISCFPATPGNFIPHKDITLPPLTTSNHPREPLNNKTSSPTFLGFTKKLGQSSFIKELEGDPEFLIVDVDDDASEFDLGEIIASSKFCLFLYGTGGDVSWLGEALRLGCVPVLISDRPIQDLPLMDVLKWSEIAVFVGTSGGGIGELKGLLGGIGGERYDRMRGLGVTAALHFVWNDSPQPFDAFHMVMYQLWLRRHVIRYARREEWV
ncbi:hypothetical protein CsSME_00028601 [Camellia sinensis var. sinensis]